MPLLELEELDELVELDELELDEVLPLELLEDELELDEALPLELLDDELDELLALGSPPQAVKPAAITRVITLGSGFIGFMRCAAQSHARARAVRIFIRPSTRIRVVKMDAREDINPTAQILRPNYCVCMRLFRCDHQVDGVRTFNCVTQGGLRQ